MTLIVDAAPLVALADVSDPMREPVRAALIAETGPLVIPAPVMAEIDYPLGVRHGRIARRRFPADLAAGRFAVEAVSGSRDARCARLRAARRPGRPGRARRPPGRG